MPRRVAAIPRRYHPGSCEHPDTDNPDLTAQLDTLFPQSERDFLAGYVPWTPEDPRGGDRCPSVRHDGWTRYQA
ncbi:MAG: hypothetical protein ACK5SX_06245 [Sandaracinobacter sp.]